MTTRRHVIFLSVLILINPVVFCDESQSTVNGKTSLNVIDERFLSVSLDPAIFFSGIVLSPLSTKLAKHLTPAFVRIAGPSTAFLKFTEDDSKATDRITEDTKSLRFGPQMWWSLNQRIQQSNFTPVFALNDRDRVEGKWDPQDALPLLEMTAKMNVRCLWQLGYDSSDKTDEQYKQDLITFKHILDAFPGNKENWKIVGSDISNSAPTEQSEAFRRHIDDLEDLAEAIMWEPEGSDETNEYLGMDNMQLLLNVYNPKIPIWTSNEKSDHPVTFNTALEWALKIGETARNGFDVIFRQPRLQELYSDTPVYWVSLLHKSLVGRNVLDVKTTSLGASNAYVYAHCAKNQNSYSIRGALTVMVVNNGTAEHRTSLRVAGTQMKNVEVRSYILTSSELGSMNTFLNDEKLSLDNYPDTPITFLPKLRRAKATTHLALTVPPKSISFFVLPGARIPICISDEDDTNDILEDMQQIQNIDFPDEKSTEILTRINRLKAPSSLSSLFQTIEREIDEDEKFYKNIKLKPFIVKDDWKKSLLGKMKPKIPDDELKIPITKKPLEIKKIDFKNLLKKEEDRAPPMKELDLSSAEILRVLTDRAKSKVEKRIGLANTDLDEILEKAFKSKMRLKRDINMPLLMQKVGEGKKQHFKNYEQKTATIRKAGQTSDEFFDSDESMEQPIKPPSKIYAGFASAEDNSMPDMEKVLPGLPIKPQKDLFSNFGLPSIQNKEIKSLFAREPAKKNLFGLETPKQDLFSLDKNKDLFSLDGNSKFSMEPSKINLPGFALFPPKEATTTAKSTKRKKVTNYVKEDEGDTVDEFGDLGDDLNGYHGFHEEFGDEVSIVKPKSSGVFGSNKELWEFDDDFGDFGDDGDVRTKEFVINKSGDEKDVQTTIKRLENYFNTPQNTNDDFDSDFETSFDRFRRDLRKLSTNSLKDQLDTLRQRHSENLKNIRGSFTKTLSPRNGIPKNYDHQIKFLKGRLAHKKRLEEVRKAHASSTLHATDLHRKLRTRFSERPKRSSYDIRYDEIYIPKINISNTLRKSYEPKLEKIQTWRPEDILKLPKQIYEIDLEDMGVDEEHDIPILHNNLLKNQKRLPRHTDINSDENKIDGLMNTIEKDGGFFKPLLDGESGEYAIVFPGKDKISLTRKDGDVAIKIHKEEKKDDVDSYTCLASDFTTTSVIDDKVSSEDDADTITTGDDHPVVKHHRVEGDFNFLDKIVRSLKGFIDQMQSQIKYFFN